MKTAARKDHRKRSCPWPNGCSESGERRLSLIDRSRKTWLVGSASEWAASASIAAEPLATPPAAFASAMNRFAPSATSTVRLVSASRARPCSSAMQWAYPPGDARTLGLGSPSMQADGLAESVEKMRREGLPDVAIETFEHYYRQLAAGERGSLPESELEAVEDVPDAGELPEGGDDAREALGHTVVLKLNGGLGTSMGMTRAKSLLEVKDGLTFLDIIARQVLSLRERSGVRLPLVLMNSFYTREDSLAALARYPEIES